MSQNVISSALAVFKYSPSDYYLESVHTISENLMDQFKEGDIVRVKCGGPAMSVLCVTENFPIGNGSLDTAVFCVWDCGNYLFEQAYPPYALDIVRYERRRYARD